MAEAINFDKARSQYLIDCLAHGKTIEGVRTHDDMLMLAGACLFVARSHGSMPQRLQDHEDGGALALENLPAEFLVSTDEQFIEDSNAAVEFYAHLSERVADDEYDDCFEPTVRAFVYIEDGGKKVHPLQGFREQGFLEQGEL